MTDWSEAGRKADAHRIRDLYRAGFTNGAKTVARRRATLVLRAAGGQTVLDLWGGGTSAKQFVQAGFHVISVDDGSLVLKDRDRPIRAARKRRALEYTAQEDGYEARWGSVPMFASECDVAFLDFCGPWSRAVRQAVEACRHMKAIVVTLVTDHDINTTATSQQERVLAYQVFLKLAFGGPIARARRDTNCRVICRYKTATGHPVLVFLVSRSRLVVGNATPKDRYQLMNATQRAQARIANRDRMRQNMKDPDWRAKRYAYLKAWSAANPEREEIYRLVNRHRSQHLKKGAIPRKPCSLCEKEGRLGAASPA